MTFARRIRIARARRIIVVTQTLVRLIGPPVARVIVNAYRNAWHGDTR